MAAAVVMVQMIFCSARSSSSKAHFWLNYSIKPSLVNPAHTDSFIHQMFMGPLLFVRCHPQLWGYTGKAHLAITEHMLQEEIQFRNFLFQTQ